MIQRDYIQRMIEQLAEVLAKVLHLPLDGAREVLEEASEQHVDMPLSVVYGLPVDGLIDRLTTTHRLDWTRVEFLGHLLSKDGDYLLQAKMPDNARAAYRRAYACLDYADAESGIYDAGRAAILDRLRQLLQQ